MLTGTPFYCNVLIIKTKKIKSHQYKLMAPGGVGRADYLLNIRLTCGYRRCP